MDIETEASKYITEEVLTFEDALVGAKHIISEYVSDDATYRKHLRELVVKTGIIVSKGKKKC